MKPHGRKIFVAGAVFFLLALLGWAIIPSDKMKQAKKLAKRQWLILNGSLVDVGGYRLWHECRGSGSPTVVFDAGLNMTRESWGKVPQETAKFTRVCVYERAGLGESDKPPLSPASARTSEQIIAELHALLQNAGEHAPFLLVGHSFGGVNARLYASSYPQEIAGLVLIDASHEDEYQAYAALKPPNLREIYLRHEAGGNYERIDLLASANEIRNAPPLPPRIPLVVLSANAPQLSTENDANSALMLAAHDKMQASLARLLPNSRFIAVKDSGHFIQLDKPETVIEAIRGVCENQSISAKSTGGDRR